MVKIKPMSSTVLVAVRVRPLLGHDRRQQEIVAVLDTNMVVCRDPSKVNKVDDPLRAQRTREKRYAFDHVFGNGANNDDVHARTTQTIISGILDGYNATVFAYGQTGSGKTFTMIGSPEKPGLMALTLGEMFAISSDITARTGTKYTVSASFLEIYNELMRDLLEPSRGALDLRENPLKGPEVAGISEWQCSSKDEIMGLLRKGNRNRSQESTAANSESSRSHAVLQVVVAMTDPDRAKQKHSKLSLIDLAGSERASNTENRGMRLREGANINRSLLALGNVINALGKKGTFVPYRDSKLTRLLKDSLGGNCRTVSDSSVSSDCRRTAGGLPAGGTAPTAAQGARVALASQSTAHARPPSCLLAFLHAPTEACV
jgi:kinesin family protein 18/19